MHIISNRRWSQGRVHAMQVACTWRNLDCLLWCIALIVRTSCLLLLLQAVDGSSCHVVQGANLSAFSNLGYLKPGFRSSASMQGGRCARLLISFCCCAVPRFWWHTIVT